MITFFSNPRPFKDPFDQIQRNAIQSWKRVCPDCQIILFEDEEGTTFKAAEEIGVQFVKDRQTSQFGTPMLNSSFKKAKEMYNSEVIVQISTDIILTDNFVPSVQRLLKIMKGKPFFMSGRRWDLDISEKIDFTQENWQKKIMGLAKKQGKLHGLSAMDYWVLSRNIPFEFPPFVIGRIGTDSWLVYKLRSMNIPVVDATEVIDIIHQSHPYPRKVEDSFIIEEKRNIRLAGGLTNLLTLREADWLLTKQGLIRPKFPRRIFSELALFYPWRILFLLKRKINRLLKNGK